MSPPCADYILHRNNIPVWLMEPSVSMAEGLIHAAMINLRAT